MKLNCIHPNRSIFHSLSIELNYSLSKSNDFLDVVFLVYGYKKQISHLNNSFQLDQSVIGLWNYDVVEIFISNLSKHNQNLNHYFEFNVSPLNQYFELEIFKPREKSNNAFTSNFKHHCELTDNIWKTYFQIPLHIFNTTFENLNLYGNFCACLGKSDQRTYWSSFLPMQEKPDFHLPQYFRQLF